LAVLAIKATKRFNMVAIVGSIIGLVSPFFGWLTVKPNRLAIGNSLTLWDSPGWTAAVVTIILWIAAVILSALATSKRHFVYLGILINIILIISFTAAGYSASAILANSPELTRVSLSSGIFLSAAGALIVLVTVRQHLVENQLLRNIISWSWLTVLLVFLFTGWFNNLSILQEFFANSSRFRQELLTHIYLFSGAILAGVIIGIPLGVWAVYSSRLYRPIFFLANITQTIPSLALFGIMIAPLSALSNAFPFLRTIGIRGIGPAPAIIALIIYALLPIIQNTYTGLHQINPAIIDAGRGMGMNRRQILRRVEVPLAIPLILVGVRTAAVQAIGNTAVAALIGAGGLGQFIFQGLGQAASDLIIIGAIPIIMLALIIDRAMQLIAQAAVPRGFMEERT
jgi:osmoprotectant transport system permease protein